jgi:hypothetical protein
VKLPRPHDPQLQDRLMEERQEVALGSLSAGIEAPRIGVSGQVLARLLSGAFVLRGQLDPHGAQESRRNIWEAMWQPGANTWGRMGAPLGDSTGHRASEQAAKD